MSVTQENAPSVRPGVPDRVSLRSALRNEVKYGLRYLMRDTLQSERRVQTLLAQEHLPRDRRDAITSQLLLDTVRAAIRRIPRYRDVKETDLHPGNVRDVLAER